ncbi:hypothetical protein KHQ82_04410 [Mycoplasmatota bacterium]|nr:hypothetical protein KHQ82_04410 [Mycoplasmatota bacterium]
MNIMVEKLEKVFGMNNEFLCNIEEVDLKLRIDGIRSNTIASQIACVAGGRDSYAKCILEDEPFSWRPDFSYDDRYEYDKLINHLGNRSSSLIAALKSIKNFSLNQESLIIDLISHEYLHQGQIIRYFYANELEMPNSVKSFWHLED